MILLSRRRLPTLADFVARKAMEGQIKVIKDTDGRIIYKLGSILFRVVGGTSQATEVIEIIVDKPELESPPVEVRELHQAYKKLRALWGDPQEEYVIEVIPVYY